MSSEEKKLEEKVKDLTKVVEALIELETARAKRELAKEKKEEPEQEPKLDKEALMQELREVHLGELVTFAIKKDLIPRGTAKTVEKE